jgi:hypothetical protein
MEDNDLTIRVGDIDHKTKTINGGMTNNVVDAWGCPTIAETPK